MQYMRGSEWRRWELHMHTPYTQKNDQFEGNTAEEKWDCFYRDIAEYIGDGSNRLKNIAVLAVTDYLSIDNYKKVINDKRLPSSIEFVLPNVEMRIVPMAKNSPINIHCLFNPSIVNELEDRFFAQLTMTFYGRKYSATHSSLQNLGRQCLGANEITDEIAYSKGIEQFVLSVDAIKEVFDKDPDLRANTIIAISNSDGDGVSGLSKDASYFTESGSQLDSTRQQLYCMTDMIFSPKQADRDFFLGKKVLCKSDIIKKYGALKPCVHGSDAHKNSNIFEPANSRYCWIKSDPTFNGLRQILYEPEQRVRISPTIPEVKSDYQVIDKVVIEDENFSPAPVYFNDKLTCIIGGKSTGKSLLLNNIARTIDRKQVDEKNSSVGGKRKILSNVKVHWTDGMISSSFEHDNTHKIVYIPQTYLNRLSDEQEELTEIDKIIEDILLNNSEIRIQKDTMQKSLSSYKAQVNKEIYDLLQINTTCVKLKEELRNLGSEKGIEQEIKKLKKLKEDLSKDSELSVEDIAKYDDAKKLITELNSKHKEITEDLKFIDNTNSVVEERSFPDNLTDETYKMYDKIVKEIIEKADQEWNSKKNHIIQTLSQKQEGYLKNKEKQDKIVKEIEPKIQQNSAIKEYSDLILKEENKLVEYSKKKDTLKKIEIQREMLISKISKVIVKYRDIHKTYGDNVNSMPNLSMDGLDFSVTTQFRSEAFKNKINELYDKRQLKARKDIIDLDEEINDSIITEELTRSLITMTLNGIVKLTGGKELENALRELLNDWYNTTYQVKMDADSIEEMSPGKKALVLLKMLINLAESECPILIDQPEDDLDNRSIFEELIPFISKKKIKRQIIIVTHNANVVLGGDAEEIIIANQEGGNSKNNKYRFEYRSGSIENDIPINENGEGVLDKKGIQQQICDILEGGKTAFDLRKNKYRLE